MKVAHTDSLRILKRHIQGCSVSLKPAARRTGVDTWFPYYAGYSSDFVREALFGLSSRPGWTVLDPWNGSGTTTAVADSLGCDALGFDINPVAALVAAARLVRSSDAGHSSGLARELVAVATRDDASVDQNDPMLAWLSQRATRRFRSIESSVLNLLGTRSGVRVNLKEQTPPPFASFFLLCLIRAAKQFVRIKPNTNPTWVTPGRRGDARTETFDKSVW